MNPAAGLYLSRPVLSWAFYDFANSGFATTILSVVFNVYFAQVVCADGVPLFGAVVPGEAFWGYTLSASMLAVFLIAPPLGAIADAGGLKKKFLACFWAAGCVFTALLALCGRGDYWAAAAVFAFANVGFAGGNVFYNALLRDVSSEENVGRVSGFGWALGYLGGGALLALNLALVSHPAWLQGWGASHAAVRASFITVAFWWALFALPLFLWTPEAGAASPSTWASAARNGMRGLLSTLRRFRERREAFKFLAANLIYNDGIETVILMASLFGARELGMSQSELILCFLMIQAVAFAGALGFGHLADAVTHKRAISLALAVYIAACAWAAFLRTRAEFWALGAVVGLVLGGSQAASRSLLTLLVPKSESARFFGFFALAQKLSTVVGPLLFGLVVQFYGLRAAVAALTGFFALGLLILYFVREPARIRGALPAHPPEIS